MSHVSYKTKEVTEPFENSTYYYYCTVLVRSAFVERHFGNFDIFFGGGGQHDRHLGHLACGGGEKTN